MNGYPLAHVAKIFDTKLDNIESDSFKTYVSPELWNNYLKQFLWLFYEFGRIQCKTCQNAYKRHASSLECDEWTFPNEYNRVIFNKENLILILKIHNFSENHMKAENILNNENSNFNSIRSNNGKTLVFMKWERYLDRFPWLYAKQENPGCIICEKAYDLSKKMTFTIWTDRNLQEIVRTDRPTRFLMQHQISKHHRTAEDIIRKTKQEKNIPSDIFTEDLWQNVISTYPWLYYCDDNYHCQQCDKAYNLTNQNNVLSNLVLIKDKNQLMQSFIEHYQSSYHENSNKRINSETSIILSTDDEKVSVEVQEKNETKPALSDLDWSKLTQKYYWLFGENGWYYGCKVCQYGRKLNPGRVPLSNWTEEMLPFNNKVWYTYLVKKCYRHNVTQGHVVAASLAQGQQIPDPSWPSHSGGLKLHFTTLPDGTAVCKEVLSNISKG